MWRTRRPWTERTQVPQEIERSEKSQSVSQSDVREVEPVDFSETLPRSYSYSTSTRAENGTVFRGWGYR